MPSNSTVGSPLRAARSADARLTHPKEWKLLASRGVGPFDDSLAVYKLPDGSRYVWESRRRRKGRGPRDARGLAARTSDASPESRSGLVRSRLYAPHRISWWIAVVFIAGSVLFTLGAAGSLLPSAGSAVSEVSYFIGAILFTIGIYLQIFEGLNASDYIGLDELRRPRRYTWFAWRPRRLEFVAPLVLLGGSLLFNGETSLALYFPEGTHLLVGVLSFLGSFLFVVSTYLQYAEVIHGYLSFRPHDISWWVAVCNVVGSAGFLVGSAFGLNVPGLSSSEASLVTNVGFLAGSVLFLIGSFLMLVEIFSE